MSDILTLTHQIEQAQVVKAQKDRMERLLANADFRALILDGFCRDECARHAQLSVDAGLTPEDRADALGLAQAAGYLKRWIQASVTMGNHAENAIPDMEETLSELRAEENAASTVEV
jgi:hypothetical protein